MGGLHYRYAAYILHEGFEKRKIKEIYSNTPPSIITFQLIAAIILLQFLKKYDHLITVMQAQH